MSRRVYFAERRLAQEAAGLCRKNSCKRTPIQGKTLCEEHRKRACQTMITRRLRVKKVKYMGRTQENLPDERTGFTQKFTVVNESKGGVEQVEGYFQTGEYPDGRLGEIFIRVGKPGSEEALLDQWAISTSIALQYGAPVRQIFGKAINTRFKPYGSVLQVEGIKRCTSILDLIARCVIRRYGVEG